MAFMDVAPKMPNGETVILFHGKNFNGYYWKDVIPMLTSRGFRVIVPDQIGWGKSDRPNLHYSFHQLAENNKKLLDSLNIKKVVVFGHSMGGMLATRFSLMFPETVSKLILENPIGLEDYRTFVPYAPLEKLEENERKATLESIENYQKSYYPVWKPEYKQYAEAQAADLKLKNFPQVALVNALTYQMIYEQPVVYEFEDIKCPTLLIIGQADRTIVGKARVPKEIVNEYGQYPELGRATRDKIKNSKLVELEGAAHSAYSNAGKIRASRCRFSPDESETLKLTRLAIYRVEFGILPYTPIQLPQRGRVRLLHRKMRFMSVALPPLGAGQSH